MVKVTNQGPVAVENENFPESAYKRIRFRVYKYVGEEVKRKQRFECEYRFERTIVYYNTIVIHDFCCITADNKACYSPKGYIR